MTDRSGKWTRRQFSQALAVTAASSLLVRTASGLAAAHNVGFAFAGASAAEPMGGTVRVYRVSGDTWQEVQSVQTASPAHLVMHPTVPVLYVIHDVSEWQQRPRGAVSAYRFDTATGLLTHAGTQPLSLSATNPRHAVVTAGGRALFVAAETGGIYNLLPIDADGRLQPVSAIRKEFGSGEGSRAKTSAPRQLVLHADGSVYAADSGQETVTRFEVSRGAITVQDRIRTQEGAGASQVALSNAGGVYALNSGNGSISMHATTAKGLSPAMQTLAGTRGSASMQMHPNGGFLAVSDGDRLQVLRVHPSDGRLTPLDSGRQPSLQVLRFNASGTQLAGVRAASGEIVTYGFDPTSGLLSAPRTVAQAYGATSLLLHLD